MGNDIPNNKKSIYEELNKTIDSFNSNDENSQSDEETQSKTKISSKLKSKKKYNLKKHKNIHKELRNELIESSIIISDFLINNIINKNTNIRNLPDTNIVNSLLLIPDEEGLKLDKQMDYCEKIVNKGINDYKREYKSYSTKKKKDFSRRESLEFDLDFDSKNPENKKIIFISNNIFESEKRNIKTENNIFKSENNNFLKEKPEFNYNNINYDYEKKNNINNNINNTNVRNNSSSNSVYQPKKPKHLINRNIMKKNFVKETILSEENRNFTERGYNQNNINNNKIQIENNEGVNFGKNNNINKINFSQKRMGLKNNNNYYDEKSANIDNEEKHMNNSASKKIYYNIDKLYKNRQDINNKNRDKSADNIIKVSYNKNMNQKVKKKIIGLNCSSNNEIINQNKYFNDINKKENISNFTLVKQNNNINIIPRNLSKTNYDKSTKNSTTKDIKEKFKSKDSVFYLKNKIELESEYRKSKKFFNEDPNKNEKTLENLNHSSLKEFVNNQASKIRQSPDYIRNNKIEKKNENSNVNYKYNEINKRNIYKINTNYINNNISQNNGINYTEYNLTNYSNKNNRKDKNKNKIKNSKNNNNNHNNHNINNNISNKKNVITIDLRRSSSSDRYKK